MCVQLFACRLSVTRQSYFNLVLCPTTMWEGGGGALQEPFTWYRMSAVSDGKLRTGKSKTKRIQVSLAQTVLPKWCPLRYDPSA